MEPAESIQNMGLHQESPQFLKPKVGWCRIKEFDKNPKGFFLGQGSPSARKRLSQNIPAWFLDFSYSSPLSSLLLLFFYSFSWSPFRTDWCYASTSPLSAPCPPWLIQQNLLMFGKTPPPLEKGIFFKKKKLFWEISILVFPWGKRLKPASKDLSKDLLNSFHLRKLSAQRQWSFTENLC